MERRQRRFLKFGTGSLKEFLSMYRDVSVKPLLMYQDVYESFQCSGCARTPPPCSDNESKVYLTLDFVIAFLCSPVDT
jgi:hypothetical protein